MTRILCWIGLHRWERQYKDVYMAGIVLRNYVETKCPCYGKVKRGV